MATNNQINSGVIPLDVHDGGTGVNSIGAHEVVIGGSTSAGPLTTVSGVGNATDVLTSQGPGLPPIWAPEGSVNFNYTQAFWVAQHGGSDANVGTNINEPFLTLQHAINVFQGGMAPSSCVIYLVDSDTSNTETITTAGIGTLIYIEAPGVRFSGTWTVQDAMYVNCDTMNSYTCSVDNSYITANSITSFTSTSVQAYVNCYSGGSFTISGGILTLNTSSASSSLILSSSANVFINGSVASIINDGTCIVNGVTGSTLPGLYGHNMVSGPLTIGTGITTGTFYTLPDVDGTNGQVLTTNGTGTVSWQNGGGGGNFDYQQSYWIAQNNGSDSNTGTNINEPFLTIQNAITTAATAQAMIYAVDRFTNTETLATSGAGQAIYLDAPGTNFQGTITVNATDNFWMSSFYNILTFNVASGAYTAYLEGGSIETVTTAGATILNVQQIENSITATAGNNFVNATLINEQIITGGNFYSLSAQIANSGTTISGGAIVNLLSADAGNTIDISGSSMLNILSPNNATITNDGTSTVTGIVGQDTYNIVNLLDSKGNPIVILSPQATPVNYIQMSNAATGGSPLIAVTGSDTDVPMHFQTRGLGFYTFFDGNSNSMLDLNTVASSVNNVNIINAATGNAPFITVTGSDTNIALTLAGKGTSGINIQGFTDGSSASSGFVGEVISSNVAFGAPVSLSNGVAADLTSISLTAGDWDVYGNVGVSGSGNNMTLVAGWTSTTSATLPDSSNLTAFAGPTTFDSSNQATPIMCISLATTTTVFLSVLANFAAGTASAYGNIIARRVR